MARPKGVSADSGDTAKVAKGKATKPSNGLKRPMSAYFLWLADNRDAIAKEINTKGSEVLKVAGARWKTLTEADKKKYTDEAARLKTEYEKAKSG